MSIIILIRIAGPQLYPVCDHTVSHAYHLPSHSSLAPPRQQLPFSRELGTLEWLGKHIGVHALRREVLYRRFASSYSLLDPEISDINVSGFLRRRAAPLDQRHTRKIILIHQQRSRCGPFALEESPDVDTLIEGIRQSDEF